MTRTNLRRSEYPNLSDPTFGAQARYAVLRKFRTGGGFRELRKRSDRITSSCSGVFLDRAWLFGDGTARPLGMLNPGSPALVVVPKNANTPAGSIILEDVLAMFAAQAPELEFAPDPYRVLIEADEGRVSLQASSFHLL